MKRLWLMPLLAVMLALGLSVTSASAATVSPSLDALKSLSGAGTLVEKTHGCHRGCAWGPVRGWWHRHVGPHCRPTACVGPRHRHWRWRHHRRCWIDRWGHRRCR
ncbi:MAG: hypothetical protein KDJ41_14540 [Hyphomicrobiaceae bacterium]|nr:hypothetical protein [Hyphomicrobiaceae bacterium]